MDPATREYLHEIRAALAFDPPLADRITTELADHLAEAAENGAGPADPSVCFGPALPLAQACAAAHGPRRLGSFLRLLVTALLLVILTMRLRLAFLPPVPETPWLLPARLCDRYGLIAALLAAAVAGFGLWRQRRTLSWPLAPRRLALGAVGAVLVSCLGGGVLTLTAWQHSRDWLSLVPLATTLAELVALILLAGEYRRLRHYPGLG